MMSTNSPSLLLSSETASEGKARHINPSHCSNNQQSRQEEEDGWENKAINRADNGELRNLGIGQRHTARPCTRASFGEGQEAGNESIARVTKLANKA